MIYLITNCVSYNSDKPTFDFLFHRIDATMLPYCFTVVEAMWLLQQIIPKPDDFLVFNIGVNSCLYRKNTKRQWNVLETSLKRVLNRNDKDAINYYREKIEEIRNIPLFDEFLHQPDVVQKDKMFQIVSFSEFESYIKRFFKVAIDKFGHKIIVLSINWFPKNHSNFGWAYDVVEKVNSSFKEQTSKYEIAYIDLWSEKQELTYDGIHLTEEGHIYVAYKINEKIAELKKLSRGQGPHP
jgi:hypothetical protein